MHPLLGSALGALATALLLAWPRLDPAWRRLLAVMTSAAGLFFLVPAFSAEGVRETPVVASYLVGPEEVTGTALASASLPYHVLTAVCLLLGTLGLAVGDELRTQVDRHWLATAIALAYAATLVRFLLEKAAAPPLLAHPVGVTAMIPVAGAFFALRLAEEGRGPRALLGALLAYGVAVRAGVATLAAAATLCGLGTHYDLSAFVRARDPFTGAVHHFAPGSAEQVRALVLFPQLVFWPLATVAVGFGAGSAAFALRRAMCAPPAPRTAPAERQAG